MEAPALKIPCASARCFTGNHSPLLLTAPGHRPASPSPRRPRTTESVIMPLATAWAAAAKDQTTIDNTKPIRVPILSYNLPDKNLLAA
ncbi:MAG: Uncharacterised protein [Bacteroidota bacterium]|nr:MAG: Uncharacterised protein [Bacteroidota bacterium]